MDTVPRTAKKLTPLAAACLLAVSGVVGALGIAILLAGEAPARMTRFGAAGPLHGAQATWFGASVVLLGLLPLIAFARRPRVAAGLGTVIGCLLLVAIFLGVRAGA